MRSSRPVLLLSALLAGCGGGGTGPSAPGGTTEITLHVVDGFDNRPVAGAAVQVGGTTAASDGTGAVRVRAAAGDVLRVQAAGFLDREMLVRSSTPPEFGAGQVPLWDVTVTPASYVFALAYGDVAFQGRLSVPRAGTYEIAVAEPAIRADPAAMAALRTAAAQVAGATRGRIAFTVGEASGGTPIVVRLDPTLTTPTHAIAIMRYSDNVMQSAEIHFLSVEIARTAAALHEMGHVLGLSHSPDPADLMAPIIEDRRAFSFTANELRVLAMMQRRLPGNRPPDVDLGVGAATPRQGTVAIP